MTWSNGKEIFREVWILLELVHAGRVLAHVILDITFDVTINFV